MHGSKPLVALPTDFIIHNNYPWYSTTKQYISFVIDVLDCIPILIPHLPTPDSLDSIYDKIDGVVMTGSISNVHPSFYNQEATKKHEPFDLGRDNMTLHMIRKAIQSKIPLLCICRGFQELNVALGGSLDTQIQELPNRMDHRTHHTADLDKNYTLRHDVTICPNTLLADILQADHTKVNSLHAQGIQNLAPPLEINALAADSTIEAVSLKDSESFVLGLQWHPEYWAKTDPTSNKIGLKFKEEIYKYYNNHHT